MKKANNVLIAIYFLLEILIWIFILFCDVTNSYDENCVYTMQKTLFVVEAAFAIHVVPFILTLLEFFANKKMFLFMLIYSIISFVTLTKVLLI